MLRLRLLAKTFVFAVDTRVGPLPEEKRASMPLLWPGPIDAIVRYCDYEDSIRARLAIAFAELCSEDAPSPPPAWP